MINHIRGTVTTIDGTMLTVDVGGIGLGITVPRPQQYTCSQQLTLITALHWNQETGPQLFGFVSETERQLFTLIISCSGIGPKMALSILGQLSPEELITIITLGDVKALSSLKGIGTKKAETLLLHLGDKVKKLAEAIPQTSTEGHATVHLKNIIEVLSSLDYSRQEISSAMDYLKKQETFTHGSFDELLRKSLTFLAKNRHAV